MNTDIGFDTAPDMKDYHYDVVPVPSMNKSYIEIRHINEGKDGPMTQLAFITRTLDEARQQIKKQYPKYKIDNSMPKRNGIIEIYTHEAFHRN